MLLRNRVLTLTALLALAALPAWGLPPCTQQMAWTICQSTCGLYGQSCTSAGLDFSDGCRFVYSCNGGPSQYMPCSCGGGCFLAGTEITMADGSVKAIEQIQKGDLILAWDEASGEMKPDKVLEVHEPKQWDFHLLINGNMRLTPIHQVLSDGRWVEIGNLKVGDTLTRSDGTPLSIESLETVQGTVTVYNFAVNPYETYVADGVIVHNKPPIPHEE